MRKKGYTVAELVFSLMLLTAFLLLNMTLYTNSLRNMKEAERLTQAINIAVAKTEKLQATNYEYVKSEENYYPYVDNENYIVSVDVTEDENIINHNGNDYKVFKNITVKVTYIVGGKEDTIELKSLKVNNELIEELYGEITI